MFRSVIFVAAALALAGTARAQSEAEEVDRANNPLAPITAINFQNYYVPTLYGLPDQQANSMLLRGILGTRKMILRATLPVSTVPSGASESASGLGDLNVFDAILLTKDGAKTQFGVGPLLVVPTATADALGAGKWQGGPRSSSSRHLPRASWWAGSSPISTPSREDRTGRTPVSWPRSRSPSFSFGAGFYARSTGVWQFDLENDTYSVPFGVGVGKVMRAGKAVLNVFLEPQFSVLRKGTGQPSFQVFAGINVQFPKRPKAANRG